MPPPSPHPAGDPTPWSGWIFFPLEFMSHVAYTSIVVSEYPAAHWADTPASPLPHLPSPGIPRLRGQSWRLGSGEEAQTDSQAHAKVSQPHTPSTEGAWPLQRPPPVQPAFIKHLLNTSLSYRRGACCGHWQRGSRAGLVASGGRRQALKLILLLKTHLPAVTFKETVSGGGGGGAKSLGQWLSPVGWDLLPRPACFRYCFPNYSFDTDTYKRLGDTQCVGGSIVPMIHFMLYDATSPVQGRAVFFYLEPHFAFMSKLV